MNKATTLILCALLLAVPSLAQVVQPGSRMFIAEMDGGLDGFIPAEITKRKIPIVIVINEADADYILAGVSKRNDDKWYHTVFGGKDKNEGSVRLISVADKTIVWAAEAGDRSLWFGGFKRGGQRKVAARLVKKMKKLFKEKR